MKRIILSLLIVHSSFFIAFPQASITVFSENGEKFWVILNGTKQNKEPMTNVKVEDMALERYKIKIIFEDEALPAIDDNIYTKTFAEGYEAGSAITPDSQVPADATYVIKKKKSSYILRLNNMEPAKVKVSKSIKVKEREIDSDADVTNEKPVNTTVQTTVKTTTTKTNEKPANAGGINMNFSVNDGENNQGVKVSVNADDTNLNMGMDINDNATKTTHTTTTTTTTTKSSSAGIIKSTPPPPSAPVEHQQHHEAKPAPAQGCVYAMSSGDFNTAKASITKQSFADGKTKVAKQVTKANCLSVAQVKEVMGLFSFEGDKLDFAKFAYTYTVDKKNYYQLNDAFSFSSSVDELNEFLEAQEK
jgi:hypothetical protein